MCGIVGYIGSKKVLPILLDGLSRLEYRGYDSSGVSYIEGGEIKTVKKHGRLDVLKGILKDIDPDSNVGIGHTRWATHGEPNDVNSHPHLSAGSGFSIVHNGIIENYMEIRESLLSGKYEFVSDTDTEVIAHLINHFYSGDLHEAVRRAVKELKGSYAIAVLCKDCPEKLVAAKKDSPLIIGLGENGNFIASDIPAIIRHTRDILILGDGETAVIGSRSVEIYDILGNRVNGQRMTVGWDAEAAEKSGYGHFMLKEIHDEPQSVKACVSPRIKNGLTVLENNTPGSEYFRQLSKIWMVACGTAYHAAAAGKYLFERYARISVEADLASEFRYRDPIIGKDDLVIIISQSGETIDTLFALREAKRRGARVLAIVNVAGSSIAREADNVFYTYAGPEIAVASTKAYTNQLVSLFILCAHISKARGTISDHLYGYMISELIKIPEYLNEVLELKTAVREFATRSFNAKSIFFIGRGIDYALSMEGSLKLKEVSYIHSEAYAGGELKHGTIALIEEGSLVVCSITQDSLFEKMMGNIKEVKARGATVLAITHRKDRYLYSAADEVILIPKMFEAFTPVAAASVMQLFAYYMAVCRGNDVDKPRNLAKCVTVE